MDFVQPHLRSGRQLATWGARYVRSRKAAGAAHRSGRVTIHSGFLPNSRLRRRLEAGSGAPDMVLVYMPSKKNYQLLRRWKGQSDIIYDHVVDWTSAPKDWFPPRESMTVEKAFVTELSARVITDSREIASRWKSRGHHAEVVYPAADDEFLQGDFRAEHAGSNARKVLGYFGSCRYQEIDVEILRQLSFIVDVELVGPVDEESRLALKDSPVKLRGAHSIADLPPLLRNWDAIVLPYRQTRRSISLTPAKIWNAVVTMKPVILTGLVLDPELRTLVSVVPPTVSSILQALNAVPSSIGRRPPTWGERWRQIERGRGRSEDADNTK